MIAQGKERKHSLKHYTDTKQTLPAEQYEQCSAGQIGYDKSCPLTKGKTLH